MHRIPSFVLGASVAFTLSAGAWSALHSAPVAPAAADGTLGMALMSAVMNTDGTLFSGTGVVSSANVGVGNYDVVFERSLNNCALTAMPSTVESPGVVALSFAIGVHNSATSYKVFLRNDGGNAVNTSFHIVAFCHK